MDEASHFMQMHPRLNGCHKLYDTYDNRQREFLGKCLPPMRTTKQSRGPLLRDRNPFRVFRGPPFPSPSAYLDRIKPIPRRHRINKLHPPRPIRRHPDHLKTGIQIQRRANLINLVALAGDQKFVPLDIQKWNADNSWRAADKPTIRRSGPPRE